MRQILLQKLRMKEYDQKQKTLAKKKKKLVSVHYFSPENGKALTRLRCIIRKLQLLGYKSITKRNIAKC